jgi:hypothetical protein
LHVPAATTYSAFAVYVDFDPEQRAFERELRSYFDALITPEVIEAIRWR